MPFGFVLHFFRRIINIGTTYSLYHSKPNLNINRISSVKKKKKKKIECKKKILHRRISLHRLHHGHTVVLFLADSASSVAGNVTMSTGFFLVLWRRCFLVFLLLSASLFSELTEVMIACQTLLAQDHSAPVKVEIGPVHAILELAWSRLSLRKYPPRHFS